MVSRLLQPSIPLPDSLRTVPTGNRGFQTVSNRYRTDKTSGRDMGRNGGTFPTLLDGRSG